MARNDDDLLRIRPGPVRNRGAGSGRREKSFTQQVRIAMRKAGGDPRSLGALPRRNGGRFNARGRGAKIARDLPRHDGGSRFRPRRVVVKARIVKLRHQRGARGPKMRGVASRAADAHLRYLEREGVTRDGAKGRAYSAFEDHANGQAFIERGREDKYQFRFIVAPEDAGEIEDLRRFTRDLMRQMEEDLETRLDWIAVDHYNTGHPHSHILMRGVTEDGKELRIAGDYIAHGIRHRASELVTLELGPQTETDIARKLEWERDAERFTRLDRILLSEQERRDIVDLRPDAGHSYVVKTNRRMLLDRVKKLETLGLARETEPGRWKLSHKTEPILRDLGERAQRLENIHHALDRHGLAEERGVGSYVQHVGELATPVAGRVLERGLAGDGLDGRFYAVIDGVDGRVHYVEPSDPSRLDEVERGHIVSLTPVPAVTKPRAADHNIQRMTGEDGLYHPSKHLEEIRDQFEQQDKDPDAYIRSHVRRLEALRRAGHVERIDEDCWKLPKDFVERGMAYDNAVQGRDFSVCTLSAFGLDQQVTSDGATWLDRELVARNKLAIAESGFGRDVNHALDRRAAKLVADGLATSKDGWIHIPGKTIGILERQEVERFGKELAASVAGGEFRSSAPGDYISGVLTCSVNLMSGRYALLEDGLGFQLVPWQPELDKQIDRYITGVARDDGMGIDWKLGRGLGIGL